MTMPFLPPKKRRPNYQPFDEAMLDDYALGDDSRNPVQHQLYDTRADEEGSLSRLRSFPRPAAADATRVVTPRGHTGIAAMLAQLLDESFGSGASRRRDEFARTGGPAGQLTRLAEKLRALRERGF